MKNRFCIYCQNHKNEAKYPVDDPKFCSIRCVQSRAYESYMDMKWCDKHQDWYNRQEGCDQCNEEGNK